MAEQIEAGEPMPSFGPSSEAKKKTCDPRLQTVLDIAIKIYDFTILCGERNEFDQTAAVSSGASKTPFPESKHNLKPGRNEKYSLAVDIAPYPINWNSLKEFYFLAGLILAIAKLMDIPLRWGGDFNRDYNLSNDRFIDLPHFEIDE